MTKNTPLTSNQIEQIKKEFVKIDKDGDGQVSTKELEAVLRSMRHKLKASEGDIKKALKEIDRDGDGVVDVHEYIMSRKGKTSRDLIHRALVQRLRIRKEFERFDKDQSGFISKTELMQVLEARGIRQVTLEQINELLKEIDVDASGEIDYEEFVLLMTK
jgi:Ca2+-binding EF-hand superfamily protein